MSTLFLFDFDGVLIDSAGEIVITSYNAVSGMFYKTHDEVPEAYRELFLASKGSSRDAGEMIVLARLVIERIAKGQLQQPVTREELVLDRDLRSDELGDYKKLFFETREKLIEFAPEAWLTLHKPVEPFWSTLQRKQGDERVFLLTHKNGSSVNRLLSRYQLEVAPGHIYSADSGKTKHENFRDLVNEHPAGHYIVVDDAPDNLIEIADHVSVDLPESVSLTLIHANWGYGKLQDPTDFQKRGIQSLSLDEFLSSPLFREKLQLQGIPR